MYNTCCVVSCNSRRKDVNFYRFPKCETGLKKWLQFIDCNRLRSLNFQDLYKHFVCKKHFEQRFLAVTKARSRLRVGAYPTLFSDSEILSGIPHKHVIVDNTQNSIEVEHSYSKKRQHEDHCYCKVNVAEKRPRFETELDLPTTSQGHLSSEILTSSNYSDETTKKPVAKVQCLSKFPTRRRPVIFKKKLSPCCVKLHEEYVKSRKQLNFHKRAQRALKFSKEKSFEKLTKKLNPFAKKILWMQIRQCTKRANGRRYSEKEKLIALSIFKQSPKCYRFLQKIFILPSKYTLNKMVAKLNIESGINSQIFEALKRKVLSWESKRKYCTIIFDELALETSLNYDKHKDCINGLVEFEERTNDIADHALVFMLRGALYKWQQPLAFYFCKGATTGVRLKSLIKNIILAVCDTGLQPIALVSDQGSSFQSALKSLQNDTRKEQILAGDRIDDVIIIHGQILSIIYDPPHLIKGIRNNFLTKNIKYKNKISKWSDIVEVYKTDCHHAQMRLLHKLNDEHVIPEKVKKMKVKNCVKVLSRTVASTLSYTAQFSHYADGKPVSNTLKNTSEMVSFFDNLFDSVNGASLYSKKNKGKALRHAVTAKSPNHIFWKEAVETLSVIKFVDKNGKESSVPSIKNWITTIKSFQRLWQFFKTKKNKIMRPRFFNSDPIENFFGQVRAYNFRNNNPSCHTFKSTFRSLLITRFIQFHSDSYNCEDDSSEQLLTIKALFERNSGCSNEQPLFPSSNDNVEFNAKNLESSSYSVVSRNTRTAGQERLNVHSRAYTTGWVVRKILKSNKCKKCECNLTSNEEIDINNYISFREYENMKKQKLTYPSEYAVRFFGDIVTEANDFFEKCPQRVNILKYLSTQIKNNIPCVFLDCEQHKCIVFEYFVNLTLQLTVFNWCNIINKILKGTDIVRLENKILPHMQLKALNKYKTKLKNKKLNK